MAEKITLKNALANLPQKTDVDSIVATDASGNPVYIKKADLAQVVAELIGTATTEKDGLLSVKDYRGSLQRKSFSNNIDYKIGNIKYIFSGFLLIGVETAHCELVNICICKNNTKLICSNKPDYVKIKVDSDGNIYLSVMMGWSVYGLLIGSDTTIVIQSPPSDAVDVEVAE